MTMHRKSTFLVAGVLATVVTAVTPLPALATGDSPLPKVKISKLSGPTIGPGGEKVYTFDVTARDPDGIITGVTVEVMGENYHTGTSVLAVCAPGATPGRRFRFQVSERLPDAGVYRARASATSVASCEDFHGPQSSRPQTRKLVARS
jgi:hypothetical protein